MLRKLWNWVMHGEYAEPSPLARCRVCGEVMLKSQMIREWPDYFCSEEHRQQAWQERQW
jgi:hypothetical protein